MDTSHYDCIPSVSAAVILVVAMIVAYACGVFIGATKNAPWRK